MIIPVDYVQQQKLQQMPDYSGHLAIYISEDRCLVSVLSLNNELVALVCKHREAQQFPHAFIQSIVASYPAVFQKLYSKVCVIVNTSSATLLPNELSVSPEESIQLITHSPTRQTFSENLPEIDAKLVYSLPVKMVEVFNELFQDYELQHSFYYGIKQTVKLDSNVYLVMDSHHFDVFVQNNNKLQLANRYSFEEDTDVLYYVLAALKDAQIDAKQATLRISGTVKKHSSLTQLLSTYIKKVEISVKETSVIIPNDFDISLQDYEYLLNLWNENY